MVALPFRLVVKQKVLTSNVLIYENCIRTEILKINSIYLRSPVNK